MSKILDTLKQKYEAEIAVHKNNVEMFIANNVGVADHINYAETVEKELEEIAKYKDLVSAINEVIG
jgi:uncharacterized protein YlxP (DUF503 family)